MKRVLCALLCGACTGASQSDAGKTPAPDAGVPVGKVETFANTPSSTEGIAFGHDAQGNDVIYAGGGNKLLRIDSAGAVSVVTDIPAPLGIAVLSSGDLVVCGKNGTQGVIWKVTVAGDKSVLVSAPDGTLTSPNMLAVARDDSLVFSDSQANRVFRANADGSGLTVVTSSISYPNGMAFSSDGTTLYVAAWNDKKVYTIARASDGTYGEAQILIDGVDTVDGISLLGNGDLLFTSSAKGVLRYSMTTHGTTELASPENFTLVANGASGVGAFGGDWLYVTDLLASEVDRVYVGEAGVGLPVR